MKKTLFEHLAYEQFIEWERTDKTIFRKIAEMINEIKREPFKGTGKPEPLKHQLTGCWSRRITGEHRLVYKVTGDHIIIISCKYHY